MSKSDNTGKKQSKFKPGQSGNPNGRPRGSRNKATIMAEILLDSEAQVLTQKAIDLAMQGEIAALKLCLERIIPSRKEAPIHFELPKLKKLEDATKALIAVLEGIAGGQLTLSEGQAVVGIIETFRRALETEELEKRIMKLEEHKGLS